MRTFSNPDKPVQLVKHYDQIPKSKLTWPCRVEKKYDGVYCALVADGVFLRTLSRTGKEFYGGLIAALANDPVVLNIETNMVAICELINPLVSLEELSGLVNPNRVNNWTDLEFDVMHDGAKLIVHDYIHIDAFFNGFCAVPFWERLQDLQYTFPDESRAEGFTCISEENMFAFADKVIADGGEGIVRKELDAAWEAGHKGWRATKIVRGVSYDLEAINVKFGEGKRTGRIAAIQFLLNDKPFWADLGKGWDDAQREALTHEFLLDRKNVVGKIFKVKALQISSKGVLRLPKVEEMRIDKFDQDTI